MVPVVMSIPVLTSSVTVISNTVMMPVEYSPTRWVDVSIIIPAISLPQVESCPPSMIISCTFITNLRWLSLYLSRVWYVSGSPYHTTIQYLPNLQNCFVFLCTLIEVCAVFGSLTKFCSKKWSYVVTIQSSMYKRALLIFYTTPTSKSHNRLTAVLLPSCCGAV